MWLLRLLSRPVLPHVGALFPGGTNPRERARRAWPQGAFLRRRRRGRPPTVIDEDGGGGFLKILLVRRGRKGGEWQTGGEEGTSYPRVCFCGSEAADVGCPAGGPAGRPARLVLFPPAAAGHYVSATSPAARRSKISPGCRGAAFAAGSFSVSVGGACFRDLDPRQEAGGDKRSAGASVLLWSRAPRHPCFSSTPSPAPPVDILDWGPSEVFPQLGLFLSAQLW